MSGNQGWITMADLHEEMNSLRKTLDSQKIQIETLLEGKIQTQTKLAQLTFENESLRNHVHSMASTNIHSRREDEEIFRSRDRTPPRALFHQKVGESQSVLSREESVLKKIMDFHVKRVEEKINKIPGVPRPIKEEPDNSYADSPFVKSIDLVEIPKRFVIPNMPTYDGTGNPIEHVALYKQKMMTSFVPQNIREAIMCKSFGATLSGPALTWFINLPNYSIRSFAEMINMFKVEFATSRPLKKQSSDLYHIRQRSDETLRNYLNRFNKEKVKIYKCDIPTAIEAFRQGLFEEDGLYKELTKYPCATFEDVEAKAMAQVRFEEDKYERIVTN